MIGAGRVRWAAVVLACGLVLSPLGACLPAPERSPLLEQPTVTPHTSWIEPTVSRTPDLAKTPLPTSTLAATLRSLTRSTTPSATSLRPTPSPTSGPGTDTIATPVLTATLLPDSDEDGQAESPSPAPAATPPSPAPTAAPVRTPVAGPAVWEQDISIDTYGWQQALVPTEPEDPIYPYPRLDFDAVAGPAPRTYRAVFVQNGYVQIAVVPELGGRILRWTDRTTGRQLLYANPVIKPTHWGYRGWWLATGGIEWAFPTEEHGLNEYRPWQYEALWNGVRVWDTDDRTGLRVEVTIRVDGEHSYFSVSPRISNETDGPQAYQFWANAMLTLSGGNAPSPELVFVLPDDAVTVHANGDGSLPGAGGTMAWPVHTGRDFGRYAEWQRYLGVFADPATAPYVGAYDLESDQGIVRVFPHTTARGVKIFCLGDLASDLWADDSSRYFELWGGLTSTFWEYWTLQPGAGIAWTEYWYPVSGIGGFSWANTETALRLTPAGDAVDVAVATSRAMDATVVVRRGGAEVGRWQTLIAPGHPFRTAVEASAAGGEWGLRVLEGANVVAERGP